ncbi:MAG: hypothetical protein GXO88_00505, partial [Chlorobi bacterium]|nr:hypothetical protein [Chlorobiota bacterium]
MKKLLILTLAMFTVFVTNAQTTYVPDDNFEQALIDLGYDNVLDNYVLTANIDQIESLFLMNLPISDLTGIQSFTALTLLSVIITNLTSLDISNNTALTNLTCSYNHLTSLDVSNNLALEILNCDNNNLTNIDVSNNS